MTHKHIPYRRIASLALTSALALSAVVPFAFAAQTSTNQITISTTVQDVLTFNVASNTVALGNLTPGTPVTGTVTAQVTTNAQAGFTLAVKRDDADTTLDQSADASVNITDKTEWDPTANTGDGNGATWSGTGLGFRVNTASTTASGYDSDWWGTTDASGNAKFAGLPSSYQTILSDTDMDSAQEVAQIDLKLDVPSDQESGAYDGTFTLRVQTAV